MIDFLNANLYRSYPFKPWSSSIALPTGAIVDFQCEMIPECGFVPGVDYVYLHSLFVRPEPEDPVFFVFRATCFADPAYHELFFRYEKTDPYLTTKYSLAANLPHWRGWMTIGRSDDIPTNAGSLFNITPGEVKVEPSRVRVRNGNCITSWNIANRDRIHATAPTACNPTPASERLTRVYRGDIRDDLIISPGYNAAVATTDNGRSLEIGGLVGGGRGEPCDEIPLWSSEVPSEEGGLLTGGPRCSDVFKSILGQGGPLIRLVAGDGITITPDPVDPHMLRIASDLRNLLGPTRFLETSSSL